VHTNRRFARTLALAGLLLAVALSSGCGFVCIDGDDCGIGCCVSFRCTDECNGHTKPRIDDATPTNDFTDLLVALFPPAELAQY